MPSGTDGPYAYHSVFNKLPTSVTCLGHEPVKTAPRFVWWPLTHRRSCVRSPRPAAPRWWDSVIRGTTARHGAGRPTACVAGQSDGKEDARRRLADTGAAHRPAGLGHPWGRGWSPPISCAMSAGDGQRWRESHRTLIFGVYASCCGLVGAERRPPPGHCGVPEGQWLPTPR